MIGAASDVIAEQLSQLSTIPLTVTMHKKIINTTTMEMEELDNATINNSYDDSKYYFTQCNHA